MPQMILPIILAATAAAGTADSIYNQVNQPSANPQPTPAQVTAQSQAAVNQETQNRTTATKEAAQYLPQLQADTSGGLSPDALQQFSATFSGNANFANSPQMQQMVARFLGLDTGSTFGGSEPFGSSSGGSTNNPLSPGLAG